MIEPSALSFNFNWQLMLLLIGLQVYQSSMIAIFIHSKYPFIDESLESQSIQPQEYTNIRSV